MIPKTDWQPSEYDVHWMQMLVRYVKEGGVWAAPESHSFFDIFQAEKRVVAHRFHADNQTDEDFARICKAFEAIGYTVTYNPEDDPDWGTVPFRKR